MIDLVRTDSSNPDLPSLVALLDARLKEVDGDQAPFFAQYNKIDDIKNVILAYSNGKAVGCGAVKGYEADVAEIKRMFVREENRGQGIAAAILSGLESWAMELGFKTAILETASMLESAVRLYKKAGYQIIPNYGQYQGIASSVCMKKELR